MSRTVGSLSTHLAGTAHTRANMLLLGLRDGTFIGITDHDREISYNLTEAAAGTITYSAKSGIFPSDVALSVGMDADNFEVTGPIGGPISFGELLLSGDMTDGDDKLLLAGDMQPGTDVLTIAQEVTLASMLGGRFNRAQAWLFQLNWKDTAAGKIPVICGNVAEIRIQGSKFLLQIRSDVDRLNQVIGRLISPYCDADFGDTRCGATPEEVVGTVTSVTSALQFTVSFAGSYVNDFFNFGTVIPLTGDLVGTDPVEIWDWTSGGAITLFTELTAAPVVGDTFTIRQGCYNPATGDSKTRLACMHFDNILNFRGFPEVPGTDQVLRVQVPGE